MDIKGINTTKIKESICQWAKLNILLLACMTIIRFAFLFATYFRIDIDASKLGIILSGSIFDLITISHIIAYGFIPFIIMHHFLPKTSRIICIILIGIYCIISLLLNEYFCNTTMPLDQVIFAYSPEEIRGIISASTSFGIVPIICFAIPIIAIIILSIVWKKVNINFIVATISLAVCIIASVSINYSKIIRTEKFYDNHRKFCLAINQPSYSIVKITDYIKISRNWENDEMTEKTRSTALKYEALFPEKEYTNLDYPLYHKNNYEDVLGSLMSKTSDGNPPNFVFIIVESLGQRLTGVEHETISFTPYIDSLKQCGLYWNNCLSAAERTFGVLPAIFASAPYGEHGFVQIWEPIPNHNSLLKDMKSNGYTLSYYYGGVHKFDRYDIFLKQNNVDYIYTPQMTNIDSATYKILNDFHRWGIDDEELIRHAIEHRDTNPPQQPYTDIYMTLSTHEPFTFNDMERYKQKVETILNTHNSTNMTDKEKNNIKNNLNIFACFAYADDCIKELMEYYKTLPEYENTIFVITGDHRMGMIPLGVSLFSFNVPLIIYSPLLKAPRSMKAVVAHEDITPTLNAYLSKNYEYKTGNFCHWLGTTLDTSKQYRCNKKIALMLNNREVVDYLNGDYYISRGETYMVEEDFDFTLIKNDAIHDKYTEQLDNFNTISQYVVKANRLKPVENIEVLYDRFFDCDMVTDNIFTNYITGNENKYIHIDGNIDYAPICPRLAINNEYRAINNDFAFDIKNNDTTFALPELVVSMDDYYMSVQLVSEDGKSLNTGNLEHFKTRITIPAGKNNIGKEIKYYLFNKHKASVDYDNISIRITAEK